MPYWALSSMTILPNQVQVIGQLSNASNATLLVEVSQTRFVYKPMQGERELWDFPTGTLYLRERAAYLVSQLLAWDVVPETIIGHGPYGIGSFQAWKDAEVTQVDIFSPDQIPTDWIKVFSGFDENGNQVALAHSANEQLAKIALFDVLINNADRKAGHLLTDVQNKIWAVDHGVTFSVEPKLRTVLWGWIDQEIKAEFLADLKTALPLFEKSELTELLSPSEFDQFISRAENLLSDKRYPTPNPQWPAVPWPVF